MNSRIPSGFKNIIWFHVFQLKGFLRNGYIFVGRYLALYFFRIMWSQVSRMNVAVKNSHM